MGQSFASIRNEISDKIDELTGFTLSLQSPDYFGRTQESIAHKGYTVQVVNSLAADERQRRAVGVYLNSQYRVIFAYRLRPLDIYPTDYDLALGAEEDVINKVLEAYTTNNKFTIRYTGSNRLVTDSQEYIIITLDFIVNHTI